VKTANQLSPTVAQWMVQALARLLGTFGFLQGVFIVAGGPSRWKSPGLAVAMLVPGAPASWGLAIGIAGTLAVVGTFFSRHRLTSAALWAMGAWCLFFAMSLVVTVLRDSRVATTGVFTYLFMAVICVCLSTAYAQSHHYQRHLRSL
jgi:ABC-type Mn2+/Zn2+ transport system permease subunit